MKVQTDNSQAPSPAAAADRGTGGAAAWPPGFRFHPTDEELILYYLKRKICKRRIKLDVIRETDVYKWDPEELPGQSVLKTGDRQWFFFTPRDRKYPNGSRSSRATRNGYWKATGKDRVITCNSRAVGVKKTLVFYRGRAPSGERTDWVMHEYTLDEQELNRCQNVQNYFALYKLYKKSGPGPKNGEQYGAPFQEEEWAEDDYVDVFQFLDQGVAAKKPKEVISLENSRVNSDMQSSILDDLEKFMNRLAEEPELGEEGDDHLTPPQVVEEAQSRLVKPSSKEVVSPEPLNVLQPCIMLCNAPANYDGVQSATSQLQLRETSDAISTPDSLKHKVHTSEDDFLEIDDLIDPGRNISNSVENLPFEEMDDALSGYDLFRDAAMFFNTWDPIDQGVSHQCVNTLDNGSQLNYQPYTENQLNYQLQPDNMVNQLNCQLQPDDMVNHFQPHSDVSHEISSQLWMHDQSSEVTLLESNQEVPSLLTPAVSADHQTKANSGPSGEEPVGATSRFSSAVWSFVDSIPTTPASAAESALVNRALERMSSFSRVRINAKNSYDDSDGAINRRAGRNKGFILFSVLGAVCAVLWVLIGTVRLWDGCISA